MKHILELVLCFGCVFIGAYVLNLDMNNPWVFFLTMIVIIMIDFSVRKVFCQDALKRQDESGNEKGDTERKARKGTV